MEGFLYSFWVAPIQRGSCLCECHGAPIQIGQRGTPPPTTTTLVPQYSLKNRSFSEGWLLNELSVWHRRVMPHSRRLWDAAAILHGWLDLVSCVASKRTVRTTWKTSDLLLDFRLGGTLEKREHGGGKTRKVPQQLSWVAATDLFTRAITERAIIICSLPWQQLSTFSSCEVTDDVQNFQKKTFFSKSLCLSNRFNDHNTWWSQKLQFSSQHNNKRCFQAL